MIYDAIEKAYTVANNNFATMMLALVQAKGLPVAPAAGGLTTTVTIEKRQQAEDFIALGAVAPTLGVWGLGVVTQAKVGTGWRDNISSLVFDYYCVDPIAVVSAKQAELAAEVCLRLIDALPDTADATYGVFGAGEMPRSVTVELTRGYVKDSTSLYYRRAKVTFPLTDRDESL